MNRRPSFPILVFCLAVAGALLGCNLGSRAGELAQKVTPEQPQAVQVETQLPGPGPTSEPAAGPAERGPGAFDLPTPAEGLDQLPGYTARLATAFKGSLSGQPYETSSTLTRSVTAQPADFIAEIDYSASETKPFYILTGMIGDQQVYKPGKDASCKTTVDPALNDTGEIPEPASQLLPVLGAEQAGEEMVGQVDSLHYTFDERSLQLPEGTAAGEVWVAKDGGWVVKYTLQIQAPVGVLGVGMEGEQIWEYEAAPIESVALPDGCSPALDGYPQLADAQDLVRMNGAIRYASAAGLAEAIQFYKDEMAAAGWEEQEAFPPGDEQAVLLFAKAGDQDQQVAAVTLRAKAGGLSVDIQVITTPLAQAPALGELPPQLPGMPALPGIPTTTP